jgi:hypothetical protein
MDATGERFAYRCLPLNIANCYGWEILCPVGFTATWDGSPGLDGVTIKADDTNATAPGSHFGHGILTFHVEALFQTDPGFDLMVQGPINRPRDGIAPLTGMIETDWSPYTFTMNWQFTRPRNPVRFEKGEPYCHFFPVPRGELEKIEPRFRNIAENPGLQQEYEVWMRSRNQFNADLNKAGSRAEAQKWQKLYYRGQRPGGARTTMAGHRTRLKLRPFEWR